MSYYNSSFHYIIAPQWLKALVSMFSTLNGSRTIINLWPQHPATHGVLTSIAILHGEIIQWISTEIGLLHRGTEKLIECNYYNSNIGYFDRSDQVSGVIQQLVFIIIVERIINYYCSNYISLWLTLFIELYRNTNHSLNITTNEKVIGLYTTIS